MNKCRAFVASWVIVLFLLMSMTSALAIDSKYMQFRTIEIDGNADDWNGITFNALVTNTRVQRGHLIRIDNETFYPLNITVEKGDVIIWENLDENTTIVRKHQISLNEDAPFTWTGNALDYGEKDFLVAREVGNYSYHTSRLNWYEYPDGNITVKEAKWDDVTFGMAFANTQTDLYIAVTLLNISNEVDEGTYLKGIEIAMDDFADGSLQGDNAVQIERVDSDYEGKDMYYENGYLLEDEDDDETSDIEMAYDHELPETEDDINYLGDFFFEIKVPIDSDSFRDLGASVGMSIGFETVLRLSNEEQDEEASFIGINDFFQGGGYPIIVTQDVNDIDALDLDPDDFFVVNLKGNDLFEVFGTILEELWMWILVVVSATFAFIIGGIARYRKKKKVCADGSCEI